MSAKVRAETLLNLWAVAAIDRLAGNSALTKPQFALRPSGCGDSRRVWAPEEETRMQDLTVAVAVVESEFPSVEKPAGVSWREFGERLTRERARTDVVDLKRDGRVSMKVRVSGDELPRDLEEGLIARGYDPIAVKARLSEMGVTVALGEERIRQWVYAYDFGTAGKYRGEHVSKRLESGVALAALCFEDFLSELGGAVGAKGLTPIDLRPLLTVAMLMEYPTRGTHQGLNAWDWKAEGGRHPKTPPKRLHVALREEFPLLWRALGKNPVRSLERLQRGISWVITWEVREAMALAGKPDRNGDEYWSAAESRTRRDRTLGRLSRGLESIALAANVELAGEWLRLMQVLAFKLRRIGIWRRVK